MALTHYVSAGLTKNEILAYLGELPAIFAALGFIDCVAMYGWDCNLPIDDLWQAQIVPVPALAAFIASSIEAEIFTPGASDLLIDASDGSFSVRVCHESDVHLASASAEVLIALAAPIAAHHPEFTYKQGDTWRVRRFKARK